MKPYHASGRLSLQGALLLVVFVTPIIASAPVAADLYVDGENASGTEDGSAQHPFNTIQEAVDAAGAGDIIHVAAGTYAGNVRVQDKAVQLLGGYVGDFSSRDPAVNITHLQGDGTDAVVTLINAGAGTLDGFRITGGTGSTVGLPYAALGGGVYVEGGAPTIAHCIIEDNDGRRADVPNLDDVRGGGVYATEADVNIVDNIIRNNTAGRGGGMAVEGGAVVISRNVIEQNIGLSDHGGGLEVGATNAEITHNLVLDNEVGREVGYGWGGGISFFNPGNTATLAYNVVTGNTAPTAGSGEFIDDGAEAVLMHELIYDNACPEIGGAGVYVDGGDGVRSTATLIFVTVAGHDCPDTQGGNGLLLDVLSDVTVTNAIFWANGGDDFEVTSSSTLTVSYTDAQEATAGTGNLSVDPLFANPGAGDYHVRSSGGRWDPTSGGTWVTDASDSPVIDAGDPAAAYGDEPAPNGGRANLGTYGNTAEASKAATATVTEPGASVPEDFVLFRNYPNPFNPATTIQYALPASGRVKLRVYDLLGRPVATLVDGLLPAGRHTVRFDATGLPGGVYFYRIEVGGFVEARAMLLVK